MPDGEGEARPWIPERIGDRRSLLLWRDEVGLAIVVLRCRLVVSVLGGGGKEESKGVEDRIEARQRKHSPVP